MSFVVKAGGMGLGRPIWSSRGADPSARIFPFTVVCRHPTGDGVALRPNCRGRSELGGFAVSPPDWRRECDLDGYTRKGRFSVCWIRVRSRWRPPPHPAIWRMPGVRSDDVFSSFREV